MVNLTFDNLRPVKLLIAFLFFIALFGWSNTDAKQTIHHRIPLYYWQAEGFVNFGDYLSLKIIEKIVGEPITVVGIDCTKRKLLGVGSIIQMANNNDVIWGSGINGKDLQLSNYRFSHLDVRAVRGPLSRDFLQRNFNIHCPKVYGDPVLLLPYIFPEFQRSTHPSNEYIIIPHCSEISLFPKHLHKNVVYPSEPWDQIIKKILDSKFVISSSLHGVIVAEAFGVPARLLRITQNEHIFKYQDYYMGTNRPHFQFAESVEEALIMGGEVPFECDLRKLYHAFPIEFWPNARLNIPVPSL